MTSNRTDAFLRDLVVELCQLPRETEWVEFKHNNADPHEIGQYISALANSAALVGKPNAWMVWGVEDISHDILGTTFEPRLARKGNEELESWLLRLLEPRIDFRFDAVEIRGQRIVVLETAAAFRHPVSFSGTEYIRIGTYKKPLKGFPEKERALWRSFERVPFEAGRVMTHQRVSDVLRLLDAPAYFDLLQLPLPDGHFAMVEALARDDLVVSDEAGHWDITNLGAILLARRLDEFPTLRRKAIRVIQYVGGDRFETRREQQGVKGYASGFASLLDFINGVLPANEVVGSGLRRDARVFPELAVRELVANALIHQDLFATGVGPTVELFDTRIEITNPGKPLVATERFLDCPPKSRNESLASLMRRFRICEERGSGVDKVVALVELHQLPPPLFEEPPGCTRVVLFAPRSLAAMDREERVRACYWHACLKYVQREAVTNTTIRKRFGIEGRNSAKASRLLKEAVESGFLVPYNADAARSKMKYLPFWAKPERGS